MPEHDIKTSLTVASFNLCNFGDWTCDQRYTDIKQLILHELNSCDCIALQEIGTQTNNDPNESRIQDQSVRATFMAHLCDELNQEQTGHHYHYIEIPPLPNTTGGQQDFNIRCGFIYTSRLSILKIDALANQSPAFIGCPHLQYAPSRIPILLHAKVESQSFYMINCHLKSMRAHPKQLSNVFKKQRHEQAIHLNQSIKNILDHEQNAAIIVLGDFNDAPNSKTLELFKGHLLESIYPFRIKNTYTTRHGGAPLIFDYILYNNQLILDHWEIKILEKTKKISDHNPVIAKFHFV